MPGTEVSASRHFAQTQIPLVILVARVVTRSFAR